MGRARHSEAARSLVGSQATSPGRLPGLKVREAVKAYPLVAVVVVVAVVAGGGDKDMEFRNQQENRDAITET